MKLYRQLVDTLAQAYPAGEARALVGILFEEVYGMSRTDVFLDKDSKLSADDLKKAQDFVGRLLRYEPIQYILGHTTFCGHRFRVAPGALIPRPETAELVALVARSVPATFSGMVLDIGTGTGCIALSVSLALPGACVTAWDISAEALAVAQQNVADYPQVHVRLEQADILQPPCDDRWWNIIVSNPPYVMQREARDMERNVLDYEPHQALFVPDDCPLLFYQAIASYAWLHLMPGGMLFLEINQALGSETVHLIESFGFCEVTVLQDEYGLDRFVIARMPPTLCNTPSSLEEGENGI